jgi:hypothetical protein
MLLLGCKSGYTELGPYAVRNNLRSIRLKCLLVTERFKLLNACLAEIVGGFRFRKPSKRVI